MFIQYQQLINQRRKSVFKEFKNVNNVMIKNIHYNVLCFYNLIQFNLRIASGYASASILWGHSAIFTGLCGMAENQDLFRYCKLYYFFPNLTLLSLTENNGNI